MANKWLANASKTFLIHFRKYYAFTCFFLLAFLSSHVFYDFSAQNTYPFLKWNMFSRVENPSIDYVLSVESFDGIKLLTPCLLHECLWPETVAQNKRIYLTTQKMANLKSREDTILAIKSMFPARHLKMILYRRTSVLNNKLSESIGVKLENEQVFEW